VRNGQKDVVVRLAPGAVVAGVVVGPDGKPWRQASVWGQWKSATRNGQANAQLGQDGKFRLEGMPDDAVVQLNVQPWGDDGGGTSPRSAQVKDVRAGTTDLFVRLEAGFSIEGTVVSTSGEPVQLGWMEVKRESGEGVSNGGGGNAVGTFAVRGLAPGTYLLVPHSQSGAAIGEAVRATAPSKGVRVVTSPTTTLKGRIEGTFEHKKARVAVVSAADAAKGVNAGSTRPQEDGTFSTEVLADVEYLVRVTISNDDRYGLAGPVRPGADVVVRLETGTTMEGTLVDAGGAPVAGRWLWLRNDRWSTNANTDPTGRFTARGLPAGRYTVLAWIEGENKLLELGQADAGDAEVRLSLPR
jgi:hypothetical protein